jgi:hypothetical protein
MPQTAPIQRVRDLSQNVLYNRGVAGAVTVNTQKLFQANINAAEFGASTTSTNNTPALQAAIDAAFLLGGGTVNVASGIYLCSSTIKLRAGVIVKGQGNLATVFKLANGVNGNLFELFDGLSKFCGIWDAQLDGNKSNNTTGNCIQINAPDLSPTPGQDYYLDFRNLFIQNSPQDGINITGVGVVGSNYYNIRASLFYRITITKCGGRAINSSRLSDSIFSTIEAYNNDLGGVKIDSSGNLRIFDCKTYYNGRVTGADLAGLYVTNSNRGFISSSEVQEEFRNGALFESCSGWDVSLIADRNGRSSSVPGYAVGYGVKFDNCTLCQVRVIADNFVATDKWQDIGAIFNNCANFSVFMSSKNQITSNFNVTGTEDRVQIFINGAIHKTSVGSGNTTSTLQNLDAGAGNDANFQINPNPISNGQALVSLFRGTNTTGVTRLNIFKGNGTSTTNWFFSGNGDSAGCLDNGRFGIGLAPSNAGPKLQIIGSGMTVSSAPPTADPGAGNIFASGFIQAAFKNQLIGVAGTFTTTINAVNQVDSFFLCNTTLPTTALAGTWIIYVDNNTNGFQANPLTINAGSGWTIDGATSLVYKVSGVGLLLVSNGTNRWNTVSQGKIQAGQELVAQVAHGFVVNNNVRATASGYVKAQANSAANAKGVCGRVVAVVDANTFILQDSGVYGTGFTAGAEYWLSAITAGGDQTTAPSTTGQVQLPVGIGTPSGQFRILIQSGTVNP